MSICIETGYAFSVPNGTITQVEFERKRFDIAWGVKDGRVSWLNGQYTIGKDLFMSRSEAVKAAEESRQKKLASLRKQIAKLEKIKFSEVP